MAYLPADAEAGLRGRQQGEVGRGRVRGSLQGLDQPGGAAEGAGAHDVRLPHAKPEPEQEIQVRPIRRSGAKSPSQRAWGSIPNYPE